MRLLFVIFLLLALPACTSKRVTTATSASPVVSGVVTHEHVDDAQRARQLVAEMNTLRSTRAAAFSQDPNYDAPGEVVAAIKRLEDELTKLGYRAVWTNDTAYVLEKIESQK